MLFSSFTFLFQFLPATLLAFAAARRHSQRAGILVLLTASLIFYGAWNPAYLLLLAGSMAMNFTLGLLMEDRKRRRVVGIFGVTIDLALLAYFKYSNFLLDSLGAVTGAQFAPANVVLPLGISFFTFQQIAYLVDVMRGAKVERDVVSYALFVSFFPHLIAGPLVHHAEMIPQFKRTSSHRAAVLAARAVAIFSAGLFKKVMIADELSQFVSPIFTHLDAGGTVPSHFAWLATLAYTLQIYFDFSGYSDMAIGLALLFGVRLPVNFRSPYRCLSIIEFWRCWHITLSRFLRDCLYIPLGGNRQGSGRRYLNLMTTMLLGGLWHGAGWNFVIWGGLHGAYLVTNHLWRKLRGTDGKPKAAATRVLSWSVTFGSVVLAWVFFRAATLGGALRMFSGMFGYPLEGPAYVPSGVFTTFGLPIWVGSDGFFWLGATMMTSAFVIAIGLPNALQILGYREYRRPPEHVGTLRWRPSAGWAALVAAALTVSLFGMWQRLEFLYFQF
ncbi:MBOAT family protein [Bradyrhizobium sp. SZCCHNR3058]|uniref:MBOAT family O-acyltransferase n=1 Tax=Bradyrhizobium sp. SZCCHNR3058 TaxID=3057423 RepID=UPI002915C72E|nr:MBOAT family protein [Bradyrhizobium sp. SZCCHNR3058]